ncbi:MAG TPA: FliM/FliN family flagellar motor switch protein [Polyangiaceae bacterium]
MRSYPWGALEPVSRAAERVGSGLRRRLRLDARAVGRALGELLELPTEIVVRRSRLGPPMAPPGTVWLGADGVALGVFAEPALAACLAAKVLRRSEPLVDPLEPLSPALLGLVAALAVEGARRAGVASTLLEGPPAAEEALLVDATLLLEGRPFAVAVAIVGGWSPSLGSEPARLARLGELELRLPLVIATCALTRQELLALQVFGALLPGAGATVDLAGVGRGMLVAPQGERAIAVEIRADGRLVVGEAAQARLSVEREKPSASELEAADLTDVLLDTPIVVRVELGAVSMTAREWAELGPGDVIETAQRIAEPVLLRVAGREVGRGELVNVDGQVGVRIHKLYEGDS